LSICQGESDPAEPSAACHATWSRICHRSQASSNDMIINLGEEEIVYSLLAGTLILTLLSLADASAQN